jgi:hypothetical protein
MHLTTRVFAPLFLSVLVAAWPLEVAAQLTQESLAGPTVKTYGRPGYAKVTVFVWGAADTGVWEVEQGTDLLEFLSVAARSEGGTRNADTRNYQYLRVYREDPNRQNDPFFESRMDELFSRTQSYPEIQEGDILVIESRVRRRFTWRDITQVTGTLASLVSTYLLLDRLNDN